jgi:YebC/PmpR family DNA-binding regulatory protein
MSGHSKWHSIKHKKGAADAKRGKIFTQHAKLIQIAAREGGSGDPGMNPGLATAIENAKADNVPNANIDRAIKKGTGEGKADRMTEETFEAYGPGGAACIIECLTDNRLRTISNVKSVIEKRGGKWAESGAVRFLFERKGVVVARGGMNDDLELALIDAGAEDIDTDDGLVTVTAAAAAWPRVRDALKGAGLAVESAGLKYVPQQTVPVADLETAQKLLTFIEHIEEDDDVSEVHTNADIAADIAAQLG